MDSAVYPFAPFPNGSHFAWINADCRQKTHEDRLTARSERGKITAVPQSQQEFFLTFGGSLCDASLMKGGSKRECEGRGAGFLFDEVGLNANRWRRCGEGTINMADPDLVTERLAARVRMILFAEREI